MFRRKNNLRIPIHWIHTQGYCEYQIHLEHVQKVKLRPTPEMKLGIKRHIELEEDHKAKAELKMSPEEALTKAIDEKVSLICRELPVMGLRIHGLIDEVRISPNQITIIDDKLSRVAYLSTKKQIWGYCLAFEENYSPNLPLIACIRHRDTQDIVWEKKFTTEDRKTVQVAIGRIIGIVNQSREAQPTSNPNKCMKCRFQNKCDVRKSS